ncbi:MAG: zinc ribbon domain-containing protein [Chthoniobacter sp.]|uniref:zinc ribbon domain-containing protein n=1 Tax=Chthoniobacter sp. TaxID=2510640 RepID=UPI0032A8722E
MKTMIWKELRENLRWAALAFFVLLLAEIFTLSSGWEAIQMEGVTLCSESFLLVSSFGCAAVGAVLGSLQILPELRRDQWASLLHRPVPRHVIFLGKVIAGLVLYVLATGLPLLASTAYVVSPGRAPAPFVPSLLWPPLSDILLGAVLYFGAVLVGLHGGRWFGSRGVIVLALVAIFCLHLTGLSPFLLPLGAMVTLFVAAWGAMLGSLAQRSWASRLAFGLPILVGLQTGLVLIGLALSYLPRRSFEGYTYTRLSIARDGTVFLLHGDDKGQSVLQDLQGNVVTDEKYVGNGTSMYGLSANMLADRTLARGRHYRGNFRSSQGRVEGVAGMYGGAEVWYLLPGARSYFIGYDKLSARCIGICDAEGFKSVGAAIQPFASDPQAELSQTSPYLCWVGPQVLAVDFTERQMIPLLHVGSETVYGLLRFPYDNEHPRIAVALGNEIRISTSEGAPVFTVPYGYPAAAMPQVSITATEDFALTFVEYIPHYYSRSVFQDEVHLDALDRQGKRVATYSPPPTNYHPRPPTLLMRALRLIDLPGPSLLASFLYRHADDDPTDTHPALAMITPAVVIQPSPGELATLVVWAVLLSAAAGVWARRLGFPAHRTVTWMIVSLVFGLAGFLAYRLATAWAARVPCPHCGRPRPVDAATCPHCQQTWQAVAPSGAEIFEAA